ncbi:MAG: (2Fe-2S)-binding protein [Gordonia sp. (in: high G+C Gram-positive bacteria)]|uniref:(2Fe-2S)-binding protein n=1 Tax=Gordonia sp. (in: high G+C Gram-positive bacteria) TaxID=84139 RepID=UPI003C779E12
MQSKLAELGGFFALDDTVDDATWTPLRALVEDGAVLDERVTFTQALLAEMAGADIDRRVAASTMSLGLFARLLAPQVAATVLGIDIPALDLDTTFWKPAAAGPWPIVVTGPVGVPDISAALTTVMRPLAEAIAAHYALSSTVLDGNIASAAFGAIAMINLVRPELADAATAVGRHLLNGPFVGKGTLSEGTTPSYVRRSCCLYYRIPGGGYCADCILGRS